MVEDCETRATVEPKVEDCEQSLQIKPKNDRRLRAAGTIPVHHHIIVKETVEDCEFSRAFRRYSERLQVTTED